MKVVGRPGCRVYVNAKISHHHVKKHEYLDFSTSKGLLTNKEARLLELVVKYLYCLVTL